MSVLDALEVISSIAGDARIEIVEDCLGFTGSRNVLGANSTMFLAIAGLFGFQFFATLYLQKILGFNAVQTGMAFIPAPLMIAIVSLGLSGWLHNRIGSTPVLPLGLALIMFGLLLLSRVPSNGNYFTDVLPAMVLIGIGFGSSITVLMGQAMAITMPSDSGLASGLINRTQHVGAAVGTAILAALSAGRANSLMSKGLNVAAALLEGFHLAYVVSAVFLGVSILAAVMIRQRAKKNELFAPVFELYVTRGICYYYCAEVRIDLIINIKS